MYMYAYIYANRYINVYKPIVGMLLIILPNR